MRLRGRSALRCVLVVVATALPAVARAQETSQIRPERAQETSQIRPEVDLLKQSVSEKLQAAAERLRLRQEEREKVNEIHRSFEARRQEMRDRRRELHESDLKAISEILTPEQRDKVQAFVADRVEAHEAGQGPVAWAQDASLFDSVVQKLRNAREQLG